MLALSDPQLKLKQGFSIAKDKNGIVIKSSAQAIPNKPKTLLCLRSQKKSFARRYMALVW
jgi:hypothetical protein